MLAEKHSRLWNRRLPEVTSRPPRWLQDPSVVTNKPTKLLLGRSTDKRAQSVARNVDTFRILTTNYRSGSTSLV